MRRVLLAALAALAGALPTVYHRKPSAALEKRLEEQDATLERALAKIEALKVEVDGERSDDPTDEEALKADLDNRETVFQCSTFNDNEAGCNNAKTYITPAHKTRVWELGKGKFHEMQKRKAGVYPCRYHARIPVIYKGHVQYIPPGQCSMHYAEELSEKARLRWGEEVFLGTSDFRTPRTSDF